jgi:hypothetical protein
MIFGSLWITADLGVMGLPWPSSIRLPRLLCA